MKGQPQMKGDVISGGSYREFIKANPWAYYRKDKHPEASSIDYDKIIQKIK